MNRKYIILASVVVAVLVVSILILGLPPSTEDGEGRFSLMTIFANSAEIETEETEGFYLSQDCVIGLNSNLTEIGDVDSTKFLDGDKFGCIVEWGDDMSDVWLSLLLRFPVPEQFIYNISGNHQAVNLTNIEFNVSFYVDVFHNSSFTFKVITPAWNLVDDYNLLPSWWISKSGSGNQSFILSTMVSESEYYAPVVENGEVLIKFSLIVDGLSGYYTESFVNLASIEVFQLGG